MMRAYRELCAAAGFWQATDRPSLWELCQGLMGAPPLFSSQEEDAITLRKGRLWRVYVRHDIPARRARWLVALEIARWWIVRYRGVTGQLLEDSARRLAATIIAPHEPFADAVEALGAHPAALADLFECEQSLALLRVGETTGIPVALCDQSLHLVMTRGDLALRKNLSKCWRIRLTDDEDRLGLIWHA